MANELQELRDVITNIDAENAEAVARRAIDAGIDPVAAAGALAEAIKLIGDRFGAGELFLPDLVGASEVMRKAMPVIEAEIARTGKQTASLGTVVIGTVFGDIHSIGKSMVATLLYAAGYKVIDLGVNVKAESFLAAVKKEKPEILAMSALLSTTAMEQKNVIEGLKEAGLREGTRVIVGGSPINQEFADSIGADGYGATAPEAVRLCGRLLGSD